ncbi:UNVERIFIED_CONTAM: Retrovirus-related Pol polyprotein from transposon RE1 [Sesamum radiatum]|uniref:Retrovirus-related Pol polyprotein from transposon RE1 n=1 Tax=Sesamum radiatum TaxID=300843 RepID=A0AAW2KAN6_SESRA
MDQQIAALLQNGTWTLITLPDSKKAISSKWIYKLKLNPDGSIYGYKTCLMAKGYNQIEGVDYTESFSPVAKTITVRMFHSIVAAYSWLLYQLDINNAFLHGTLDWEIYMLATEGYFVAEGLVCKLQKSLYCLKEASRQWNLEFTSRIAVYRFSHTTHDPISLSKQFHMDLSHSWSTWIT